MVFLARVHRFLPILWKYDLGYGRSFTSWIQQPKPTALTGWKIMGRPTKALICVLLAYTCAGCAHTVTRTTEATGDTFNKTLVLLHLKHPEPPASEPAHGVCLLDPTAQIPQMSAKTFPPPREAPSIEIRETTHDFGVITEEKELVHDFKLKNVGTAVLQIQKVLPG
jgi:hypothetical protein